MILKPVEATQSLFDEMNRVGVITLRKPDVLDGNTLPKTNCVKNCYTNEGTYGGHKLIQVFIVEAELRKLTSHPENEDFILVGSPGSKRLIIVACKLKHEKMLQKIQKQGLDAEDFFCFYAPYNDASLSFFTMNADYPHAEVLSDTIEQPYEAASFYVTESSRLPEIDYKLEASSIEMDHALGRFI